MNLDFFSNLASIIGLIISVFIIFFTGTVASILSKQKVLRALKIDIRTIENDILTSINMLCDLNIYDLHLKKDISLAVSDFLQYRKFLKCCERKQIKKTYKLLKKEYNIENKEDRKSVV